MTARPVRKRLTSHVLPLRLATIDSSHHALVGYVESLPLPPNPYRAADGALTPAAHRGKVLFDGRAACVQCHTGSKAGGQRKAWIGTTPEGMELDVPHLAGVE